MVIFFLKNLMFSYDLGGYWIGSQSVSQGATPRSEPRSANPCVDDRLGH